MYVQRAVARSVAVLVLWGALALIAWVVTAQATPAGAFTAAAQPAAGHYSDQTYGFSFDYPSDWIPESLAPHDAPGTILGFQATPVPGSLGGVEFPYSTHIDLSLIVQDTAAAGAGAWGSSPGDILKNMAASAGLVEAASGTVIERTTTTGRQIWALAYTPGDSTGYMWVVAPAGRYNYLFFLTVGGAAEDRGTVQQMFDAVVPTFRAPAG